MNANSDGALGDPGSLVRIQNGSTLQAGGDITSNRFFIVQFGDPSGIIDTNGHDMLLDTGSTVSGEILEKQGAGTLTLRGTQDYFTLTTSAGTTNVNSMLGTGFSIVNANATTNFGVSQTLAELNIGTGAIVTLGSAAPAPALAAVPEPGTCGLLVAGLLHLIARRHRQSDC